MLGVFRFLVGEKSAFSIEDRIFHYICIFITIAGVGGFVLNLWLRFSSVLILTSVFIIVVPAVSFYISRFKRRVGTAKIVFTAFAYMLLAILYIINSGLDGPVYIYFMVVMLWHIFFFQKGHLWAIIINLCLYGCLLVVEYYYPTLINNVYNTRFDRFLDHTFTYSVGAISSFIVIKSILSENLRQRILTDEQNLKLDKVNVELTNRMNELDLANKTKDKLFSVVAHDIRSFTATIHNLSSLLTIDHFEVSEEKESLYKHHIYNASSNLNDLIDNLLAWSKLQMNTIKVYPKNCGLYDVMEETKKLFWHTLKDKAIDLIFEIDPKHTVYFDSDMLESILRNIISNSIKFTPMGGKIKITSEEKSNVILLKIKDNGVGMEDGLIMDLENHTIADSQRGTKNEKGSGIGLKIVQEFLEKNNGSLSVKSKIGLGTEITLVLPMNSNNN